MDGGVKYSIDVFSGVNKCEEKGFAQKDIIVDIILCTNSSLAINPESLSPIGALLRAAEIIDYSNSMGVIEDTTEYMKDVLKLSIKIFTFVEITLPFIRH